MTRKQVYQFIKNGVDSLKLKHSFGRGRLSEFGSKANKDYPIVWFETSAMTTDLAQNSLPIDSWDINLHIARLDREDSTHDEYECIIDECDQIAQALAFIYNTVVSGNNLLTITGLTRTPFVKSIADSATGVLLNFTLTGPDTTDQSDNCE